jgi:glyoxylase-like metal-dependent hydrolase (beta-lactamase superfamily II)
MIRSWIRVGMALLAGMTVPAFAGMAIVPIKVTERVYYVQGQPGIASAANEGFNSNAGFVVTGAGVVVIDALGTPALGEALRQAIARVTSEPLRRVILTHYHADHFYGLAPLKQAGADVWAHAAAREYLESGEAERRREQRARDLFPWVDEKMAIIPPDRWLGENEAFTLGAVRFEIHHLGPAHSPEDLIVVLPGEGVVFSGDILFAGRIPFVGEADSRQWLERIARLLEMKPRIMITGHGELSRDPVRDLALTRDYLAYLRATMGKAVEDFVPFEEAYVKTDWSRFAKVPAFDAANRVNAYGTYLLMERESLAK